MDGLEQLPAGAPQQIAGIVFAVVVAIGSAVVFLRSRAAGPAQPKVQEFYAAGQLADMGPVKELVEGVGLLVQQQIRANLALEASAKALERAADSYEAHLKAEQTQEEIEKQAQALFERRMAQRDDPDPPRTRTRKTEP